MFKKTVRRPDRPRRIIVGTGKSICLANKFVCTSARLNVGIFEPSDPDRGLKNILTDSCHTSAFLVWSIYNSQDKRLINLTMLDIRLWRARVRKHATE